MATTTIYDHEYEGGSCPDCGTHAEHRICYECGENAWVIDCGHADQPRPLASGRRDGTSAHRTYCDECAMLCAIYEKGEV